MKDFPSHYLKILSLVFLGASSFKDKLEFFLLKMAVGRVKGTGKLVVIPLKLK